MNKWNRVTKRYPCPICGKPDWCLVSEDGSAVICPRVESSRRIGDSGWLHSTTDQLPGDIKITLPKKEIVYMDELACRLMASRVDKIDNPFEGDGYAFDALGCGYDGTNYSFPMCDEHGRVIGIKLRAPDGGKFCVPRSTLGLYMPIFHPQVEEILKTRKLLLMPEGESDTIACLSLGFRAVGRPSCNSCRPLIKKYIRLSGAKTVIIIADNDEAGRNGARGLLEYCEGAVPHIKIITPPKRYKDMRQWYQNGATETALYHLIGLHQ